jgi:hypothetical protein
MSASKSVDSVGKASIADYGVTSPADEFASGESAVSEEAERRSGEEEKAQATSKQIKVTDSSEQKADDDNTTSDKERHPQVKLDKRLRKRYKRLLHRDIKDSEPGLLHSAADLPPSQIDGSYWTAREKESFFEALALRGQDDLPGIHKFVATKTLPEIRRYLLLLREQTGHPPKGLAEAPISLEIDQYCETALDQAASSLLERTLKCEIKDERKRYGQHWLIHESLASDLEDRYQEIPTARPPFQAGEEEIEESTGVLKTDQVLPADAVTADANVSPTSSMVLSDNDQPSIPSVELLKPAALLQLSRSLFMNQHGSENWWTMADKSDEEMLSSPAIFRSAFEDFHELAIDITRKLVQATLLQAMSRLRASDGPRATPLVVENDAWTATELLGLNTDWQGYWVTVARRCNVHVYSEAKAYYDGRQSTKNGVKLTFNEAENELGRNKSPVPSPVGDDDHASIDDFAAEASDDSRCSATSQKAVETSQACEEDEYLEALDQVASIAESNRLFRLLDCEQLRTAKHERIDPAQLKPKKRKRHDETDVTQEDWRKRVRYESEWESQPKYSAEQPDLP